jgi:hypothetical protein
MARPFDGRPAIWTLAGCKVEWHRLGLWNANQATDAEMPPVFATGSCRL